MLPKNIFQHHERIGLDLDETLAESCLDMLYQLHGFWQLQGIQSFEQIDSFDWGTFPSCTWSQERMFQFFRSHHLTHVRPVTHAVTGVLELFQNNKDISIITARNEHDHKSDTIRWLNLYFPEIHHSMIHFANHSAWDAKTKSEICKRMNVTMMIDDALHNAEDLVNNGICCILLEKPWNRNSDFTHPNLHRVTNWQEIIDNLQSK